MHSTLDRPGRLCNGLPILRRRGIKHLGPQGGEPLLHPQIEHIIADAAAHGMRVALVTNGWLLQAKIEKRAWGR
jgi:MoaA/NifB/PqqE/SkfB family radical SAM enzyme